MFWHLLLAASLFTMAADLAFHFVVEEHWQPTDWFAAWVGVAHVTGAATLAWAGFRLAFR